MATAGGVELTFYFAWVPPKTPWSLSLARFDEHIFSLLITHDEGQIPEATVEIKNPRIGLINPTREHWAWISFSRDACDPQPLFFGRLFGVPEEMLFNTLRIKLIARPSDYAYQKQQAARALKVLPNYDPIFYEAAKRDDPDTILEGWSALFHSDRVTGKVTTSDINVGEDGTIHFASKDVFYDSVKQKLLQPPLVAINVKADVTWEQQYSGTFYVGQWAFPTAGGSEPFVGDWPKSGSQLGGGWFAGIGWAGQREPDPFRDTNMHTPQQVTTQIQFTNTEEEHANFDVMSISLSETTGFGTSVAISEENQIGIQDPYHVDENGDPDPINIPSRVSVDYFCYQPFHIKFEGKQALAALSLVYRADRKRSERLEMTVAADMQPVLIDPLVIEDTEQMELKSGDLSLPLIDRENWDSVGMGGAVTQGTIIFPDNPRVAGQTTAQIALNNGNTGNITPIFSNISGHVTLDGTVQWASLGDAAPPEQAQDWVRLARVPKGMLLLPKPVSGVPDMDSARAPGQLNYPPTGVGVSKYSLFCQGGWDGPGATIYECVASGMLGGRGPQASFHTFTNPVGAFMYIAIQDGTTGEFHPTFNGARGAITTDGSVVWQSIGQVNLPIGGWPGMTPAASYFDTERGQQSLKHMFCRARAKMRKRARAVEVTFETRFEVAAQLSCRMNGKIPDTRLPGGQAIGKIISYKLSVDGDTGITKGEVVLGCSIGLNPLHGGGLPAPIVATSIAPETDPGIPDWVDDDYVENDYQIHLSSVSGELTTARQAIPFAQSSPAQVPASLPPITCPPLDSVWAAGPDDNTGNEISYAPPLAIPNDDGLTFPLSSSNAILNQQWHGKASTLDTEDALRLYNSEIAFMVTQAVKQARQAQPQAISSVGGVATMTRSISGGRPDMADIQEAFRVYMLKNQNLMNSEGLWYELVLKPVTNGPFSNYYVVNTSPLLIPMTIDLSAPSSGGE